MNIYKLLNLCFAIKTISSHVFFIKIATVVIVKLQSCFYKTKKRKLRNSNAESLRLPFMYVSILVSFCWPVFSSSFPYFLFIFLFFNALDSFSYRFLDIYFKKSSEFNDVSKKVKRPNQHIIADDFCISELVTLAPGSAPRCGSG